MTPHTTYRPFPARPAPMPFGPPPPPPLPPSPGPRRARRSTAVVLLVLAMLVLLAGGAFAGLYVRATGDRDTAAARLDDRQGELADVGARLTASEDERTKAEQRNSGLETTKTDLTACVDAVEHYLWEAVETSGAAAALDALFAECQ